MRTPVLVAVAIVAGCGSAPTPATPPQTSQIPPAVPLPAAAGSDTLEPGFEVPVGPVQSWRSAQTAEEWGFENGPGDKRSLRVRPTGDFAAAATLLDVQALRGKHVRFHGKIATQDVDGRAGLWIRSDLPKGEGELDNQDAHPVSGTHGWAEATVEIDVAPDATAVWAGGLVIGHGTAWFTGFRVESTALVAPHPIALEGEVVGPDGAAVAGAEVALVNPMAGIASHVASDAHGHFHFDAPSGKWGLSAATPTACGFVDSKPFDADAKGLRVAIAPAMPVRGTLSHKPDAGTFVQLRVVSEHDSDLFAVPVAADGTFVSQLPKSTEYAGDVLDKGLGQAMGKIVGDHVEIAIDFTPLRVAPQEVVDWIAAHAIAIKTVEAGHGLDDLAPLGKAIGGAHVIALGEATHGTREFFQMKHRMLEYLVEKLGVTTFAIEANEPEARAIDDYVVNGVGDAKTALAGIYFWTWNTEEVLAMIEWMRAYNADAAHRTKLHFAGFDMQTSRVAFKTVKAYLAEVGDDKGIDAAAALGTNDDAENVDRLSADDRAAAVKALADAAKRFDANAAAWRKKKTAVAFDDARHDLVILQQAFTFFVGTQQQRYELRDRYMADNVQWLKSRLPKGARMMLWAHNGHVSNELATYPNMGGHLRKALGKDYEVIGFAFHDGSFQAMDQFHKNALREIAVGPPPDTTGSAAFARAGDKLGAPVFAIDLHAVPAKGAVHDWFAVKQLFREIGAVYTGEQGMLQPMSLPVLFDAVIFVTHTTRAQPVKK